MGLVVFLTSWFTPTTLFLLLNLMIGTIVIFSRFGSGHARKHPYDQFGSDYNPAPLARAPSLIDRLKSIDFHLYKFSSPETDQSFTEHHDVFGSDPHPPPLTRAPSLLDRVKSINLSYFNFPQFHPENDYAQTIQPGVDYGVVPTGIEGVDSTDVPQFEVPEFPEPGTVIPPRLARAPSLLERVKSINLSSFYKSEPTNPDQVTGPVAENPDPNPENNPKGVKTASKKTGKIKKSASEKSGKGGARKDETETTEAVERRRPETARLERSTSFGEGEQSVDAKAADFINKFKQQLKLQRLDSILRYKEMLKAN